MPRNGRIELEGLTVGRFYGLSILLPTGDNSPERKGTGYTTNQLPIILRVENMRQSLATKLGDAREAAKLAVELYHRSLMENGTMFSVK